jgi:hypothetical protein
MQMMYCIGMFALSPITLNPFDMFPCLHQIAAADHVAAGRPGVANPAHRKIAGA